MNISNVSQSYGLIFDTHSGTKAQQNTAKASSDTVNISEEARALMEKDKQAKSVGVNEQVDAGQGAASSSITSAATPENPVEMYQVPSWYGETMPIYSATVGGQSSITVQGAAYTQSPTWDKYTLSMEKHYNDALDANNIGSSTQERYQALIADGAQSLRVKNDFYGRIAADEELQGLMNTLGVTLPL